MDKGRWSSSSRIVLHEAGKTDDGMQIQKRLTLLENSYLRPERVDLRESSSSRLVLREAQSTTSATSSSSAAETAKVDRDNCVKLVAVAGSEERESQSLAEG